MVRRLAIGAAIISAIACGPVSTGSTSAPSATAARSASPSAAQDSVPPELRAVWTTTLVPGGVETVLLTLNERSYGVGRGGNRATGSVAVRGDEMRFSGSTACDLMGTYRWSAQANSLQFHLVSDPCPGRSEVLDRQTYRRQ